MKSLAFWFIFRKPTKHGKGSSVKVKNREIVELLTSILQMQQFDDVDEMKNYVCVSAKAVKTLDG